jgi:hypothetical protein
VRLISPGLDRGLPQFKLQRDSIDPVKGELPHPGPRNFLKLKIREGMIFR